MRQLSAPGGKENKIFGDWDDAPCATRPGAVIVSVPFGKTCVVCDELFQSGDVGLINVDYNVEYPYHRECIVLAVYGHEYHVCHHTDYEGFVDKDGNPTREAARECFRRSIGVQGSA